jgi:hypothetical protein
MSLILRSLFLVVISSCCTNAATGKIDPALLAKVNSCLANPKCVDRYNIVVTLPSVQSKVFGCGTSSSSSEEIQNSDVCEGNDGDANRTEIIKAALLKATAISQKSFLRQLNNLHLQSIKVETFWISNIISIEGLTARAVKTIAGFSGKFFIEEPPQVGIDQAETTTAKPPCSVEKAYGAWYYLGDQSQYQWGVNAVLGPSAWYLGNGAGIATMVVDTGINANHEAFAVQYINILL